MDKFMAFVGRVLDSIADQFSQARKILQFGHFSNANLLSHTLFNAYIV